MSQDEFIETIIEKTIKKRRHTISELNTTALLEVVKLPADIQSIILEYLPITDWLDCLLFANHSCLRDSTVLFAFNQSAREQLGDMEPICGQNLTHLRGAKNIHLCVLAETIIQNAIRLFTTQEIAQAYKLAIQLEATPRRFVMSINHTLELYRTRITANILWFFNSSTWIVLSYVLRCCSYVYYFLKIRGFVRNKSLSYFITLEEKWRDKIPLIKFIFDHRIEIREKIQVMRHVLIAIAVIGYFYPLPILNRLLFFQTTFWQRVIKYAHLLLTRPWEIPERLLKKCFYFLLDHVGRGSSSLLLAATLREKKMSDRFLYEQVWAIRKTWMTHFPGVSGISLIKQ